MALHRRWRLSDCLLRSALAMLKTCHTRESKREWKCVLPLSMPTSNTFLAKLHISLKRMLSSVTANRSLTVWRPITRKIWRGTDTNYFHSLFARLVSDTETLTQHLYSAKEIWRHLKGRFCFLGWLNHILGRGEGCELLLMLGTEITDRQKYYFTLFLNIPFRAFSYYQTPL